MMCAENANKPQRKYALLPYSQLVWDMMQTNEHVYMSHSQARVRNEAGIAQKIREALSIAILNHAVFSMHVDTDGKQYYKPLTDPLHGQYHSVDIEDNGEFIDLTIKSSRILGDGISMNIIFEDFARAYRGLSLEKDGYLSYLELIERNQQTDRYKAHRLWLEAKFDILTAPVRPTPDFPLTVSDTWEEGLWVDDWTPWQKALAKVGNEQMVTLTGLVCLAVALAIMDYNDTDEAALTWAYDGRETPIEQRIYGSLHRDVPLLIRRESKTMGVGDLLRQVRMEVRQGIAHSAYPYTLTAPHTEVWNYAVNVLQQPSIDDVLRQIPFEVELLKSDEKPIAYSLLDIEIYTTDALTIVYRYSATHYKSDSIQRFAQLVKNNMLNLLN